MLRVALVLAAGCFSKPPRPEPGDAGVDGAASARPRLVDKLAAARSQASSVTYSITIPDEADPYLLVTLQLGTHCDDTAPPVNLAEVQDQDGASQPLVSIASLASTPCLGNTHSELFELRAPAPGTYAVVLSVAGIAPSLHSAALVFANVDRANPIRETATASGEGALATVAIASEESDLIVNAVAHGTTLEQPGPNATEIFRRNIDSSTTLNNSGASFAAGTGDLIEMTWEAGGLDQWQTISAALRATGEP
jgi:hypothetical protein